MKIIKVLMFCFGATILFAKADWGKSDMAGIVRASELYYELEIKLSWDEPCNLDLYVAEPSEDTASRHNTITGSGGELGYYDSGGEWVYGDSGNNTAPEVYRVEYGSAGTYDVSVFCNPYEEEEEESSAVSEYELPFNKMETVKANQMHHVSANAFVFVTLYGRSKEETYMRFPASGTVEVASDANDGWWHVGSFNFVPIAEKEYGWQIEDPMCFVATAAYGSPLAPEIGLLCSFRDEYLSDNVPGKLLIKAYYKVSPPIAKLISRNDFLRAGARACLKPVVKLIKLFYAVSAVWIT